MSITPVDFDYLRRLMREQTAIVLDAGKEYIAESRLANLVSQEGFASLGDYFTNCEQIPLMGCIAKL